MDPILAHALIGGASGGVIFLSCFAVPAFRARFGHDERCVVVPAWMTMTATDDLYQSVLGAERALRVRAVTNAQLHVIELRGPRYLVMAAERSLTAAVLVADKAHAQEQSRTDAIETQIAVDRDNRTRRYEMSRLQYEAVRDRWVGDSADEERCNLRYEHDDGFTTFIAAGDDAQERLDVLVGIVGKVRGAEAAKRAKAEALEHARQIELRKARTTGAD